MIRTFIALFLIVAVSCNDNEVKNENKKESVVDYQQLPVKDAEGHQYSLSEWTALVKSKEYRVVLIDSANPSKGLLLEKLNDSELREIKPEASEFFPVGSDFPMGALSDINGKKVDLAELKDKTVVINYWFTDCKPCRMEIPELNEVVSEYKNDPSKIFLAITFDERDVIKEFIAESPYNYRHISSMDHIQETGVSSFPTHVVVKNGKVVFSTTGFGVNTIPWLKKSI